MRENFYIVASLPPYYILIILFEIETLTGAMDYLNDINDIKDIKELLFTFKCLSTKKSFQISHFFLQLIFVQNQESDREG